MEQKELESDEGYEGYHPKEIRLPPKTEIIEDTEEDDEMPKLHLFAIERNHPIWHLFNTLLLASLLILTIYWKFFE